MFPDDYAIVAKLRQDLKIHHFDLSNAIKDVELLAKSTKSNLRRSVRKLDLRKKYLEGDKLKPNTDAKIWKYEIKSQVADLTVSLEEVNKIVKVLEKLQVNCVKTADDLDNVLKSIKEQLIKRIEMKKIEIKSLEERLKNAKCDFWKNLITFGGACAAAAKMKGEI